MDITSFVFGVLTVILLIFIIVIIVGVVKIRKHNEWISCIEEAVENETNERIREIERVISYIDSRADKLLDKIK